MISKEIKGKGFRGALNYIYEKRANAEWICGSTISIAEPKYLTKEFSLYRKLRPEIKDPVFHGILSISKGENLSKEQWTYCIQHYLKTQGFNENHPFVAVKHNDKENEHIHIVASRIGLDGSLNRLSYSKYKGMQACRELEKKFNLRQLETSRDENGKVLPYKPAEKKRTTRQERGKAERLKNQGKRDDSVPERQRLQGIIDDVLKKRPIHFDDFCAQLNAQGVEITPMIQQGKDGKPALKGLKYKINGLQFKASSLGTDYKVGALFKRGLSFGDYLPARKRLQALIDNAIAEKKHVYALDFCDSLKRNGVEVELRIDKNPNGRERLTNILYKFNGFAFKASRMGKGYKVGRLFRQGLRYGKFTPIYKEIRPSRRLKKLTRKAFNKAKNVALYTGDPIEFLMFKNSDKQTREALLSLLKFKKFLKLIFNSVGRKRTAEGIVDALFNAWERYKAEYVVKRKEQRAQVILEVPSVAQSEAEIDAKIAERLAQLKKKAQPQKQQIKPEIEITQQNQIPKKRRGR